MILELFPAPWVVAPLVGKYYGTVILDAEAKPVLSLWDEGLAADGGLAPSRRELENFESLEEWREYCSDSHWESEVTLARSEAIAAARNGGWPDEIWSLLLLLLHAEWHPRAFELVRCGIVLPQTPITFGRSTPDPWWPKT